MHERSADPARRRRWGLAVVGAGLAAVLAVGYLARTGSEDDATGSAADMEHIHGLGVDPADGALYAGTHYGLFRVTEDGDPVRVADRVQDFMGFTVAGPGRFLASGHPGEEQGGPTSVGLIESNDSGATWSPLSLAGEADFHSLEYVHDRVYGLNAMSGELLVSEDLSTWEARSRLPVADFAVSPVDPDTILATTEGGLAESTDGGRTFTLVSASPVLQLVSWADDGAVVGAAPDGTIHTSPDAGGSWTEGAGLGGAPEALTAESATQIYAATGGRLLGSDDGGESFASVYPR